MLHTEHTNVSDELTIRYLKKRLKNMNKLIRTTNASAADYINRDRVALQLRDCLIARRSPIMELCCLNNTLAYA